jgi:hypothetical protein
MFEIFHNFSVTPRQLSLLLEGNTILFFHFLWSVMTKYEMYKHELGVTHQHHSLALPETVCGSGSHMNMQYEISGFCCSVGEVFTLGLIHSMCW